MTDPTDDQVRALAHRYRFAKDDHERTIAQTARALLDAHAELAATQTQVGDWIVRADEANVRVEKLEAELARVKTDAAVAVAEAIRRAAENKEQLDIWAQEILEGLSFADVLKIDSYNDKIEAHDMAGRGLVEVIRALAPADGLAMVQELRAEMDSYRAAAVEARAALAAENASLKAAKAVAG